MIITASKVGHFGIFLFVAALGFGTGHAVAGEVPEPPQPIPESAAQAAAAAPTAATPPTAPAPQPPADEQSKVASFPEEATVVDDEGAEFCGLPICSPPGRVWLRADYLMWWTSGMRLPPLATTSPVNTPLDQAGVLPNATVLFGGQTIGTDGRSGVRTTLGLWLDACHVWGVDVDYFSLGGRSNSFNQTSTGNPILAVPFFGILPPNRQEATAVVAFPGVTEGTVTVDARDYFQSAGVSVSYHLCSRNACCDPLDPCDRLTVVGDPPLLYCRRADLIAGFRYYNLSDSVLMAQAGAAGTTTYDVRDSFRARNDFYGGEIGLRTQLYRGRWSLEVLTKIALGCNRQVVTVDGQGVIGTDAFNAGLFAGPSNSGTYARDVFTLIPQLGVELGYQWNCHWRAYVGYDVLYWGEVARAGEQIDRRIDVQNTPFFGRFDPTNALPFPAFPNKTAGFWAHGVNVGTEFRF
jgi:hypothetical protein